jgi:predicted small metal-binding protein
MERLLRCDCGFEVRAQDDAELVEGVQRHAFDAHGMRLTQDEVRRLAERLERSEAIAEPPQWSTKGEGK